MRSYGEDVVEIYPNPAEGQVFVDIGDGWTSAAWKIRVIDVLGKVVFSLPVIEPVSRIDLASFPRGLYIVHVADGSGGTVSVGKIILW